MAALPLQHPVFRLAPRLQGNRVRSFRRLLLFENPPGGFVEQAPEFLDVGISLGMKGTSITPGFELPAIL
jgi:hypothetical protein